MKYRFDVELTFSETGKVLFELLVFRDEKLDQDLRVFNDMNELCHWIEHILEMAEDDMGVYVES
jgi:hypothetical protein